MGIDKWIDLQLSPERIPDPAGDDVIRNYSVFSTPTGDIVRQFEELQRLQRQAKAAGANDSMMTKPEARQEVLAQNPQLAQAAQRNQQMVGQIQSARSSARCRAIGSCTRSWPISGRITSASSPAGARCLWPSTIATSFARTRSESSGTCSAPWRRVRRCCSISTTGRAPSTACTPTPTSARSRLRRRRRAIRRAGSRDPAAPRARRGFNENYARELMELHTLGVDGGYTQQDVSEVARAFTGWTIDTPTPRRRVRVPSRAARRGREGRARPRAAAGRGIEDGEDVLDILAARRRPRASSTTKLARHFVSDDPPARARRPLRGHVQRDRRRHSRDAALHRHESRVFQPRGVSRQGEDAVRAGGERVARRGRGARSRRRAPRRSSRGWASRSSAHQTPDGWPDRGEAGSTRARS